MNDKKIPGRLSAWGVAADPEMEEPVIQRVDASLNCLKGGGEITFSSMPSH